MERTLPALRLDPRWLILLPAAAANLVLAITWIVWMTQGREVIDWLHYVEAGERFWTGGLYEFTPTRLPEQVGHAWHYSPLLAPVFGVLGDIFTPDGWRLLHVVPVLFLPTWPMRLVTLASWPFWGDVLSGNVMVFVLLAAAWALRGNRWGIGAYLALTMLMPKPVMLPLAAWLVWQHPEWRLRSAAMLAAHLLLVLPTGWGPAWVADLLGAGRDVDLRTNVSPSVWLGSWWLLIGIPVGVYLTWRGRPAWAGLCVSPYLISYYLLLPIAEIRVNAHPVARRTDPVAESGDRNARRYLGRRDKGPAPETP